MDAWKMFIGHLAITQLMMKLVKLGVYWLFVMKQQNRFKHYYNLRFLIKGFKTWCVKHR